jgi:hypothetical protein
MIVWKYTCGPQIVVWIQLIKYFNDPQLGQSQFSCDMAWAFPRLSFRSWCPYTPYATFNLACCYVLRFLMHGDASPVGETYQRLDDVNHNRVGCFSVQQYELDYYRYRVLRACCSILRVCAAWPFAHNWSLLCTASWVHLTVLYLSPWQRVIPIVRDVYFENQEFRDSVLYDFRLIVRRVEGGGWFDVVVFMRGMVLK